MSSNSTTTVSQIGPVTQTLDPTIQQTGIWQHATAPQPDAVVSQTAYADFECEDLRHLLYGRDADRRHLHAELQRFIPKPKYSYGRVKPVDLPNLNLIVPAQLTEGFGEAVNARTININKVNIKISDLNFTDYDHFHRGQRLEPLLRPGCRF